MERKGLVLIHTGEGKGKTTAALGMVMRSSGWGQKVCIIQFLKSPDFVCGEKQFCKQHGIELYSTGIGYSWTKTPEEQRKSIQNAWDFAKSKIKNASYDLIVLDEINHLFSEKQFSISDFLTPEEVEKTLQARPEHQTVILTGRNAPEGLIACADLVTEMKMVKHPYEKGVPAAKGIEY